MKYLLRPGARFLSQLDELSHEARTQLDKKISLLEHNPFRNKRIHGEHTLFRIRFKDNNKEKRLIYLVDVPYVMLLFILDRDKDYKDLRKELKKAGY